MEFPDLSWLAKISPFVAVVLLLIALAVLWYKWRTAKLESRAKTAAQSQLDDIQVKATGSDTKIAAVAIKVEALHSTLNYHVMNEDTARDSQTVVLREIHKQLVSLNAGLNGSVINQENTKLIIGYQWNWCRDETVRVILRSIRDNHFKGNETVVARNVYRGWNKAAKDALASLQKIDGLKYPYNPLFLRHVDFIWLCAWDWAIPLYYDKRTSAFEDKLADVAGRLSDLFDLVHVTHVDVAEDVAAGALYREDHPIDTTVIFDENAALRMGTKLRDYRGDEDSATRPDTSVDSVRVVVKSNIDDMYRRKGGASGSFQPPPAQPSNG